MDLASSWYTQAQQRYNHYAHQSCRWQTLIVNRQQMQRVHTVNPERDWASMAYYTSLWVTREELLSLTSWSQILKRLKHNLGVIRPILYPFKPEALYAFAQRRSTPTMDLLEGRHFRLHTTGKASFKKNSPLTIPCQSSSPSAISSPVMIHIYCVPKGSHTLSPQGSNIQRWGFWEMIAFWWLWPNMWVNLLTGS